MDEACELVALPWVLRKAIGVLNYLEVRGPVPWISARKGPCWEWQRRGRGVDQCWEQRSGRRAAPRNAPPSLRCHATLPRPAACLPAAGGRAGAVLHQPEGGRRHGRDRKGVGAVSLRHSCQPGCPLVPPAGDTVCKARPVLAARRPLALPCLLPAFPLPSPCSTLGPGKLWSTRGGTSGAASTLRLCGAARRGTPA